MNIDLVRQVYCDSTECNLDISDQKIHDRKRRVISINRQDMTINTHRYARHNHKTHKQSKYICANCDRKVLSLKKTVDMWGMVRWICDRCYNEL